MSELITFIMGAITGYLIYDIIQMRRKNKLRKTILAFLQSEQSEMSGDIEKGIEKHFQELLKKAKERNN